MSAQSDGWVNFADYLALNKDASQRQLQATLDAQQGNADTLRANATRNKAQAFNRGMDGDTAQDGRAEQSQKLMLDYGSFVEGLGDPSRLEAYFAKSGAGGNSALDAGLASVAGAGQIQEAQKGLSALRQYIDTTNTDATQRYQEGQQFTQTQRANEAGALARRQSQQRNEAAQKEAALQRTRDIDANWQKRGISTKTDRFGGRFAGQGFGFNDPLQNGESEWQQAQRRAKENAQQADGLGTNAGW